MLIFDSFPSGDAAKKFAAHVKEEFDRESSQSKSLGQGTGLVPFGVASVSDRELSPCHCQSSATSKSLALSSR